MSQVSGMCRLLFSRSETALLLNISERSVDYLIATRRLPSTKLGRRRMVSRHALECFAGTEIRGRMSDTPLSS